MRQLQRVFMTKEEYKRLRELVENQSYGEHDELHDIIKCNNLNCVTNNEPMATHFYVSNREEGTLKCRYCEKEVNINNVELL